MLVAGEVKPICLPVSRVSVNTVYMMCQGTQPTLFAYTMELQRSLEMDNKEVQISLRSNYSCSDQSQSIRPLTCLLAYYFPVDTPYTAGHWHIACLVTQCLSIGILKHKHTSDFMPRNQFHSV